jgi:hypothetical protein
MFADLLFALWATNQSHKTSLLSMSPIAPHFRQLALNCNLYYYEPSSVAGQIPGVVNGEEEEIEW